jgi:hypothetical protein
LAEIAAVATSAEPGSVIEIDIPVAVWKAIYQLW